MMQGEVGSLFVILRVNPRLPSTLPIMQKLFRRRWPLGLVLLALVLGAATQPADKIMLRLRLHEGEVFRTFTISYFPILRAKQAGLYST